MTELLMILAAIYLPFIPLMCFVISIEKESEDT